MRDDYSILSELIIYYSLVTTLINSFREYVAIVEFKPFSDDYGDDDDDDFLLASSLKRATNVTLPA